jgi:drug/metabolite transporter (DMT)-like permease
LERTIYLLLLTVSFLWGTSFAAAKIGLRELSPLDLVIVRFTLVSIIFGAILLLMRRGNTIEKRDIPTFFILGFVGVTSYFYIQFTGLQYTTTINSALIIATTPIMVGLMGQALKIEKINRVMALGIVIAFSGVTLIVSHGELSGILQSKTIIGDLLLLLNAVVWAGFTLYGKKILQKYRPVVAMAYMHIFGTLMLLPFAFLPITDSPIYLSGRVFMLSGETFAAILYLAALCSVYAYYMWYMGIDRIGAVRTSVFAYFNPLFAAMAGVALLGEQIYLTTLIGGCMIIAGVYITNRFRTALQAR